MRGGIILIIALLLFPLKEGLSQDFGFKGKVQIISNEDTLSGEGLKVSWAYEGTEHADTVDNNNDYQIILSTVGIDNVKIKLPKKFVAIQNPIFNEGNAFIDGHYEKFKYRLINLAGREVSAFNKYTIILIILWKNLKN